MYFWLYMNWAIRQFIDVSAQLLRYEMMNVLEGVVNWGLTLSTRRNATSMEVVQKPYGGCFKICFDVILLWEKWGTKTPTLPLQWLDHNLAMAEPAKNARSQKAVAEGEGSCRSQKTARKSSAKV